MRLLRGRDDARAGWGVQEWRRCAGGCGRKMARGRGWEVDGESQPLAKDDERRCWDCERDGEARRKSRRLDHCFVKVFLFFLRNQPIYRVC
jgi:hypothetical protein